MFHEVVNEEADTVEAADLLDEFTFLVSTAVAAVGTEQVVAETNLDSSTVDAIVVAAGDAAGSPQTDAAHAGLQNKAISTTDSSPTDSAETDSSPTDSAATDDAAAIIGELSIEDAAAILATQRDMDADTIVFELRDHILLGMTTAVIDVDAIAAAIDVDLTGQEIQQAIEGRAPLSLAALAEILAVIETRKR